MTDLNQPGKAIGFLKKYWRRILWFTIFTFIITFFDRSQEKFYLKPDVKNFAAKANLVLIVIMACLLCLLIVVAVKQSLSLKGFLYVFVNFAFTAGCMFFVFHETFTHIGLYINRQTAGSEATKTFKVGYMDSSQKYPFILDTTVDIDLDNTISDYIRSKTIKLRDTLQIPFSRGLFGVEYFNSAQH